MLVGSAYKVLIQMKIISNRIAKVFCDGKESKSMYR